MGLVGFNSSMDREGEILWAWAHQTLQSLEANRHFCGSVHRNYLKPLPEGEMAWELPCNVQWLAQLLVFMLSMPAVKGDVQIIYLGQMSLSCKNQESCQIMQWKICSLRYIRGLTTWTSARFATSFSLFEKLWQCPLANLSRGLIWKKNWYLYRLWKVHSWCFFLLFLY